MPIYRAPAKVNLFLHVIGRRDDGYHRIQSVMRLIDLCDTLTIEVRDDGAIERITDVPGVDVSSDLTLRAARLLQAASGCRSGATIGIEKRIPVGGGLGGGSSDAGTTLLALNRLWGLGWSRARLASLGLELGADVPLFVGGTDAFVEGIGERLTPIALPAAYYAVVHPGISVPTAVVFAAPELTRDSEVFRISDFSESASFVESSSCGAFGRGFRNDLEPVACTRFPAVREALEWLGNFVGAVEGARGRARMSGSGACVFRGFGSAREAEACIASLPDAWTGWSVASLAGHPHRDHASD